MMKIPPPRKVKKPVSEEFLPFFKNTRLVQNLNVDCLKHEVCFF